MTATRSPVRLIVLHDGDYCGKDCDYLHGATGLIWCLLFDRRLHGAVVDNTPAFIRTDVCKAATAPRSCAGCIHLTGIDLDMPWCSKHKSSLGWVADEAQPLMQCDGPEVAR